MAGRLGRYELGELLGEGGEGRVHRARLFGPGGVTRDVALKVLIRKGERLRREAWLGGLLRHPHLVDVYEVGEQDGVWFAAMELCTGGSLAGRGALPPRAVVEVGLQVCDALVYARRELGLVHLDLKPDNLLLDGARVKVADLGIARATGDEPSGGRGTPGYMAPEQQRGGDLDVRADVYGLGAVLLELATGAHLGSAPTWMGEAMVDPESRLHASPAWLAPVLARCLAEAPEDRYADLEALADALLDLEVDGPDLATFLHASDPAPARWADAPQTRVSRFVGRHHDLAGLRAQVRAPGVYTLWGPGGIGKSRLARELAARLEADGEDVVVCDTTVATTRAGLLTVIASALDVAPSAGSVHDTVQGFRRVLRQRGEPLLVLDGFEHLVAHHDVVAGLVGEDGLRVLVTSQAPLGLPVEQVVPLGPLPLADAIDLVVARAEERGVELHGDPRLESLARHLEGLPLALELAAGRLGVLTVDDVLERLDLSLLRSGEPGRHGTLEATLDWSVRLLDPDERATLGHLSVFGGGFSVDAATAVIGASGADALGRLEVLLDRSLLTRAGSRLTMLDAVRRYAARLGPTREAERRHGAWFAGLADDLDPTDDLENLVLATCRAVARSDVAQAIPLLRRTLDVIATIGPYAVGLELSRQVLELAPDSAWARYLAGFMAALAGRSTEAAALLEQAARDAGDDPSLAARCEARLAHVAVTRGEASGALDHVRRAEALLDQLPPRGAAEVCMTIGGVYHRLGQLPDAERAFERQRRLARALGSPGEAGQALSSLGGLAVARGDVATAVPLLEEALGLVVRRGRRARVLGNLAIALKDTEQRERARGCAEEALGLYAQVDDRLAQARILGNLAVQDRQEGDLEAASRRIEACLALQRELGDRRGEGISLGVLASLHTDRGDTAAARRLMERALELHTQAGNRLFHGIVLANLGRLQAMEGDAARGRRTLSEALAAFEALANGTWCGVCRGFLGQIALAEGEAADAEDLLRDAVTALTGRHVEAAHAFGASLGAAEHAGGDPDGVARIDAAIEGLRDGGYPSALAEALCTRARVRRRAGDLPAAVADLDEAARILEQRGLASGRVASELERVRHGRP